MNQSHTILKIKQLGMVNFHKADTIQRTLQTQRIDEQVEDTILLLEHPLVITLGKRGTQEDILADSTFLQQQGVEICVTDRGGQNTIHGPGQLVGYLIIHLYRKQRALREFICNLEQTLIDTLHTFGITAFRDEKNVGVWTKQGKIASIGICVNHGVTRHGFALNVHPDLQMFNWIVPCGIAKAQMTSMERELGQAPSLQEVSKIFTNIYSQNKSYHAVHVE